MNQPQTVAQLRVFDLQVDDGGTVRYSIAEAQGASDLPPGYYRLVLHPAHGIGVPAPVVVDGRTEEEWCQEACRIGAYDCVEVVEGMKGRWIRTFTGERTPEKIAATIQGLKAQAERYDRIHGVPVVPDEQIKALWETYGPSDNIAAPISFARAVLAAAGVKEVDRD